MGVLKILVMFKLKDIKMVPLFKICRDTKSGWFVASCDELSVTLQAETYDELIEEIRVFARESGVNNWSHQFVRL